MAKTTKKPQLPSNGQKPQVKPPPGVSDDRDKGVATVEGENQGDEVSVDTTDEGTPAQNPLPLNQPTENSKPTVRPMLDQFSGSAPQPTEQAEEEDPDAPVVTAIRKVKDPVMIQPPENDARWFTNSFEPCNHDVTLRLPLALTGEERLKRREIDVRKLTQKQAFGLEVLAQGMLCDGAQTDDGNEITSRQQAVKKFLELVADAFVEVAE